MLPVEYLTSSKSGQLHEWQELGIAIEQSRQLSEAIN